MMQYKPFIGGTWYETDRTETIYSPFDRSPVSRVGFASPGDVEKAIQAAIRGFRITRSMAPYRRAEILETIGKNIRTRSDSFVEMICAEGGKPINLARAEVKRSAEVFSFAAHACLTLQGEAFLPNTVEDHASFYGFSQRFPIGPIVCIDTFNFPLSNLAHKIAPAIAAGVSLVVKPASATPTTALMLAEAIMESGLPNGALNIIPVDRETAEKLVIDERFKLLFFSGSPEAGWKIKEKAGKKRVSLELGGNTAAIIEPDANLNVTIEQIAASAFANAGQTYNSVQRILVHKSIYEEVEQHLLDITQKKMLMGNPADSGVVVGPMINSAAAERVMGWIEEATEAGATLLTGGDRHGNLVQPTLLADTDPGMRVRRGQVFGPVAVLGSYDTFSEAITEVNSTDFGLQAGIFTHDLNLAFRAFSELEVGTVMVNDFPPLRFDHMPYGGIKDSGCGRQGIRWAMEEMTELKLMVVNLMDG